MAEAEGGVAEEGVGESATPPRAPAPAPAASGGSGRGGGGGAGGRDVCREVFERLVADGHMEAVGASGPELLACLEAHFAVLPTSYQMDVNVDKAQDVLIHQKVLAEAKDPDRRPAFTVRFLRLEEVNVETTNSDAHEEGADIGEALSTRSKAYTYIHEIHATSCCRRSARAAAASCTRSRCTSPMAAVRAAESAACCVWRASSSDCHDRSRSYDGAQGGGRPRPTRAR
ncbi:unnamed protein product [Urochloa humidicola]